VAVSTIGTVIDISPIFLCWQKCLKVLFKSGEAYLL
jgi:hypothetical protein